MIPLYKDINMKLVKKEYQIVIKLLQHKNKIIIDKEDQWCYLQECHLL